MNKYLEIAQRVLNDSQSMLTARQIWDSALQQNYVTSDAFGTHPWITLGRALSKEVNQQERPSIFGCSRGKQAYYYLTRIDLSDFWGKFDFSSVEGAGQEKLLIRIRSHDSRPQPKTIIVSVYERNTDVIAYVRVRAKYCCEMCDTPGFLKDNGEAYIEVHHLMRLADEGSDIPENAVALCADCHRKLHYMQGRDILLAEFVAELTAKGLDVKPQ